MRRTEMDATIADVLGGTAQWCVVDGDCRDVLPTLPVVDALVTDPPYGIGLGEHGNAGRESSTHRLVKAGYGSYDDTADNFVTQIVPAVELALSKARRGAVFCAGSRAWHLPVPDAIGGVFLPAACGSGPWGFTSFVHCLFYGKAPDLHLGRRPNGISSTVATETNGHPCPKPIGWMVWVVGLASRANELVLDPFAGSGTTGVACLRLGRRFIGIERDAKYAAIARERLTAESRGLSLKDARAGQGSLADLWTNSAKVG